MFGGALGNLLRNEADDVAESALSAIGRQVAPIEGQASLLGSLVPDVPQPKPSVVSQLLDRGGNPYIESDIPVAGLVRKAEFQPRTTASGRGTENSVFEKGYNEGMVEQPFLVRKVGDSYEVLGGHSRTLGMERRAAEGLSNPENVRARIYENISDEQARQIARAANQGGQYESTLDMAKSIADSLNEGVAPSVQKQNMTRGFGYDDYKYLWDTVNGDNVLKDKVFHGSISQDDALTIARHGRSKGLDPDKTMGIIRSLDANGSLSKQNAKNVINLLTGKMKAGLEKDMQTGLFGDIDTAVNSVDLLNDFNSTHSELTRRLNAMKSVSKEEGFSPDFVKELEGSQKSLQKKLNDISTEILNRYKAQAPKTPTATAPAESIFEQQATPVEQAPQPMNLKIRRRDIDVPTGEGVTTNPLDYLEQAKSGALPGFKIKRGDIDMTGKNIDGVIKYIKKPVDTAPQNSVPRQPTTGRRQSRAVLEVRALDNMLPSPDEIRSMSEQEFAQKLPSWRAAMANIVGIGSVAGAKNDEK